MRRSTLNPYAAVFHPTQASTNNDDKADAKANSTPASKLDSKPADVVKKLEISIQNGGYWQTFCKLTDSIFIGRTGHGKVSAYNFQTRKLIAKIPDEVFAMGATPEGHLITNTDHEFKLWDIKQIEIGKPTFQVIGHCNEGSSQFIVTRNNKILSWTGEELFLFNYQNKITKAVSKKTGYSSRQLKLCDDGNISCASGYPGTIIEVFNIQTEQLSRLDFVKKRYTAYTMLPSNRLITAYEGHIFIYDTVTGIEIKSFRFDLDSLCNIWKITTTPLGTVLISNDDRKLKEFDPDTFECINERRLPCVIYDFFWSSNLNFVIAGFDSMFELDLGLKERYESMIKLVEEKLNHRGLAKVTMSYLTNANLFSNSQMERSTVLHEPISAPSLAPG